MITRTRSLGVLLLALVAASPARAQDVSINGSVYAQSGNRITQTKSSFMDDGKINIGVVSDIEGALANAKTIAVKLGKQDLDALVIAGDSYREGSSRDDVQQMVNGLMPFVQLGVPTFVIPGNRETQSVYAAAMKKLQAQHPNVFDIRAHQVDLQGVNLVGMGGYHHPGFTTGGGFLLQAQDYKRAREQLAEFQPQREPTIFVTHGPPWASTRIDYAAGAGHVGDKNIKAVMDSSLKDIINVHGHIHEGGRGSDRYAAGPAYNVSAITSTNNPKGPNAGLITIVNGKASYRNIN
jgi:Icc-related predicted phosphoesterase